MASLSKAGLFFWFWQAVAAEVATAAHASIPDGKGKSFCDGAWITVDTPVRNWLFPERTRFLAALVGTIGPFEHHGSASTRMARIDQENEG